MSKKELTATVRRGEDGMYWAEVDELPGCFASGATLDELAEALTEAIALYLHPEPEGGGGRGLTVVGKKAHAADGVWVKLPLRDREFA